MRDRLRKYRKEDQAEKRFGKDINVSTKDEAPLRKPMTEAETKSVSGAKPGGAKPSSFAAAFRAAREAGQKTFTWAGKPGVTFTTEMAGEKKAAPVRRAPAASATPAKTQAAPTRASIPAPAKAVADKAAGYRAAFQRQDGRAGFTKSAPKAEAPKRPLFGEDGRIAGTRSAATRAAKLEEIRKAAEAPGASKMAQDRYRMAKQSNMYAKGGVVKKTKIDGIAQRGKTRAPMRRK